MANRKHLTIFWKGVTTWNAWRLRSQHVSPDLSECNLTVDISPIGPDFIGVDFNGGNLSYTNLRSAKLTMAQLEQANFREALLNDSVLNQANLQGANFFEAELISADLSTANLQEANLNETDLAGADLSNAKLNGATLRGSHLWGAKFNGAELAGTDFTGATFGYTWIGDVDLSRAIGLEKAEHVGPSSIGIDTIYRSSGKIPEPFLRGAGISDSFITHITALVGHSIKFSSCFISYSSKNQIFAEQLYSDLQSKGVRCWFAPEDLKIGDKTRIGIDESIRGHEKLLVILSKHSITSEWVEKEVETAMEQEHKQKRTILLPVRLDNEVMKVASGWAADIRRSRNIGDFSHWKDINSYRLAFGRLLRGLQAGE